MHMEGQRSRVILFFEILFKFLYASQWARAYEIYMKISRYTAGIKLYTGDSYNLV